MVQLHRRSLLAAGLIGSAAAFFGPLRALADLPARSLAVLNLHTGERLQAVYWESGAYVTDALAAFDKVLRDHRTGEVHPIAPGLLDLAVALSSRLGVRETIQIISGYRSPQTNALLHAASSGVATRSLHMDGRALDIRLEGVDLARLRDAAWSLQQGGVGFYPGSDFVHVDVGRVRRWNG
jgi:uncharacterized protein YcbK (DUF882 family)